MRTLLNERETAMAALQIERQKEVRLMLAWSS